MPDTDLTKMHALAEGAASAAYDRWRDQPNRDAYVADLARRSARAAVDTVAPLLVDQGRRQVLDELERDAIGRDPEHWETVPKQHLAEWVRLMRDPVTEPDDERHAVFGVWIAEGNTDHA
jgi:hypothetical protein